METDNCCSVKNTHLIKAAVMAVTILAIFLAAEAVSVIMSWSKTDVATNTISVMGTGDAVAIPDIGSFSVSVTKEAKTVAEAQKLMTNVMNPIIEALKKNNIAEKDIKTESYDINPKYEYHAVDCDPGNYCPSSQVFTGYEVTESILVKVRDISKAGDILNTVGALGATTVGGVSFSVDNTDSVKADARNIAIDAAKKKAGDLSKSLGVSLVRIVNFSENTNTPYPMYDKAMNYAAGSVSASPSPIISPGETKFTSNVSITYEIK